MIIEKRVPQKTVILFKQSYCEFATNNNSENGKPSEIEMKLKPIGIVSGALRCCHQDLSTTIKEVNKAIAYNAANMGATHVFCVDYNLMPHGDQNTLIIAYGDAYRPAEIKSNPLD